jgi:hypothetical protein
MVQRKKSNITVKVIGAHEFIREQIKLYKAQAKNRGIDIHDCDLKLFGTWGFVKTELGVYVLSRTGNGSFSPISLRPVPGSCDGHLYLYMDGVPQLGPVISFSWCLEILNRMDTQEDMPLEDFIVSFGPATDIVYEQWRAVLTSSRCSISGLQDSSFESDFPNPEDYVEEVEDIEDGEEVEDVEDFEVEDMEVKEVSDATIDTIKLSSRLLYKKEDIEKYAPFLTSKLCTCSKPKALVTVKEGICSCSKHKSHTHCSNCGGIFKD